MLPCALKTKTNEIAETEKKRIRWITEETTKNWRKHLVYCQSVGGKELEEQGIRKKKNVQSKSDGAKQRENKLCRIFMNRNRREKIVL